MIESDVFKVNRSTFARLLFERYAQSWIFGGGFLFIVSLMLGFLVNYRIFLLAIILICLVAPAMMMILYYNYGMKGENYVNVIDHRIEIGTNAVTLYLKVRGEEDDEEEKDKEDKGDKKEDKEEWRRYEYPFSWFGRYTVGKDYVVFPFLAPRIGFLYLPADAFKETDFAAAVKRIASEIETENN